jgi:hypothetical protein
MMHIGIHDDYHDDITTQLHYAFRFNSSCVVHLSALLFPLSLTRFVDNMKIICDVTLDMHAGRWAL